MLLNFRRFSEIWNTTNVHNIKVVHASCMSNDYLIKWFTSIQLTFLKQNKASTSGSVCLHFSKICDPKIWISESKNV